jgi:hypothetical protein
MPPPFETAHDRIVAKVTRAICELHLDFEKRGLAPPSYESVARVAIMFIHSAEDEEARREEARSDTSGS